MENTQVTSSAQAAKGKLARSGLRINSTLAAISGLKLSTEKTKLLQSTAFYHLSQVTSKAQTSVSLITSLIEMYDEQSKSFKFTNASIKFCAQEVAFALGMPLNGEGSVIDVTHLKHHDLEQWVLEWRAKVSAKLNKSVVLSAKELKEMIIAMEVNEDEVHKSRCKKLIIYFLLDQFLFSTSSGVPRSCMWQLVEDLDRLESYNWPQSILDWMHLELARMKPLDLDSLTECHTFGSPAPLLEVMLYQRILSLQPNHRNAKCLIEMFDGVKKPKKHWLTKLSLLNQNDIEICSFCTTPLIPDRDIPDDGIPDDGIPCDGSPCDGTDNLLSVTRDLAKMMVKIVTSDQEELSEEDEDQEEMKNFEDKDLEVEKDVHQGALPSEVEEVLPRPKRTVKPPKKLADEQTPIKPKPKPRKVRRNNTSSTAVQE